MALQPDNKVIIGGSFTTVDGTGRNRIARLNANGTLDTGFDPGFGEQVAGGRRGGPVRRQGAHRRRFHLTAWTCNHIARLKANGSVDTSFDTSTGVDKLVLVLALQDDGKVLIGGDFTNVEGVGRSYIAGSTQTVPWTPVSIQAPGQITQS